MQHCLLGVSAPHGKCQSIPSKLRTSVLPRRRRSGAVAVLVGTLIAGQGRVEASLVDAILGALAAVARDDEGRLAIQEAGGVPLIIKLMDGGPDMVRRYALHCRHD